MRDSRFIFTPEVNEKNLKISNYVPPRINQESGKLEKHLPFANYAGPGTDVVRRLRENVMPTTKIDNAAMKHDASYFNARQDLRNGVNPKVVKQKVRNSDNILLEAAKRNITNITNPANAGQAAAVLAGIKSKTIAEDFGLLDELKFVGSGRKIKDPLRKMRKNMMKKNKKKKK